LLRRQNTSFTTTARNFFQSNSTGSCDAKPTRKGIALARIESLLTARLFLATHDVLRFENRVRCYNAIAAFFAGQRGS
jgi:hypothetical protein